MAKALGDQFLPYFTTVAPSLVKYLDESHPKSDIIMIIGCLAETFDSCNVAIPIFYHDFVQILLKNSTSTDSGLNRNIAYAIGLLAEHAKGLFPQHMNEFLTGKL